jgi:hypothetical protein
VEDGLRRIRAARETEVPATPDTTAEEAMKVLVGAEMKDDG